MKMIFSKKLWVILTSVFALLFVALFVGTFIANYYEQSLNVYFDCQTYLIEKNDTETDTNYFPTAYDTEEKLKTAAEAKCEEALGEGAVLLANNGALPLATGAKVSLFGRSVVDPVYGGTGSGNVKVTDTTPTYKSALTEAGLSVNGKLWDFYSKGAGSDEKYKRSSPDMTGGGRLEINEVPWSVIGGDAALVSSFAEYGDAAVVAIGRIGGEGFDLANGTANSTDCKEQSNYLELCADEKEMLAQLKTLKDAGKIKSIVVLVNSANALELDFLNKDICGVDYGIDAALWIGAVGESGVRAVGKILAGKIAPSGHLVDTFCYDNMTSPAMQNLGGTVYAGSESYKNINQLKDTHYMVYQEGVYVGYRYYETRYEDYVMGTANAGEYAYGKEVAFPFGYGSSYTSFAYSDFNVQEKDKTYEVSVRVRNTGNAAGKDVVQVYLQSPYTEYDKQNGIEKAAVEICGYVKTPSIAKGAAETVKVSIDKEEFATYDANNAKTYILDEGKYYLAVGSDAHDALNNILAAKNFTPVSTNGRMDKAGNAALTHEITLKFDKNKFAHSSHTGVGITNQFDEADLNKFDNGSQAVKYVKRSDWKGTLPTKTVALKMTDALAAASQAYKVIENKNEEMPVQGSDATELTLVMLKGKDFDDLAWQDLLSQMTVKEMSELLSTCMYSTITLSSIDKKATKDSDGSVGINQTFFGGKINGTAYPASGLMASTWNNDLVKEVGAMIGEDCLHSGVSGWYGPSMNIHRTPYVGRNFEYFSEDGFISGEMGAAMIIGAQSKGVYPLAKHFAMTDNETHRDGNVWANEQTIREIYLKAFEEALAADGGNCHGLMVGHSNIGAVWNGHHSNLLNNVARGEWGFDGYAITDMDVGNSVFFGKVDTSYMYAPAGVMRGLDCYMCMSPAERIAEFDALSSNATLVKAMRNSAHRMLYIIVNSNAMNGVAATDRIVEIMTWWQITLILLDVFLGVLAAGCVVMLVLSCTKFNQTQKA